MRSLRTYGRLLMLLLLCQATSLFASDKGCFQVIIDQDQKDKQYQTCLDHLHQDSQLRMSVKRKQIDLLERLVLVSKKHTDPKKVCEDQLINFLSQYGIKNLVNPIQDMDEVLQKFWGVFLTECPSLKERFQSE